MRASPSSEIQDPSRERAAGTSHSQEHGHDGRRPGLATRRRGAHSTHSRESRHVTPRANKSASTRSRYRPVFASISPFALPDHRSWIIRRHTSIPGFWIARRCRAGQKFAAWIVVGCRSLLVCFLVRIEDEFGDRAEEIEENRRTGRARLRYRLLAGPRLS